MLTERKHTLDTRRSIARGRVVPIVIWNTLWFTEHRSSMSATLKIADIMTREVLTLSPELSADEAQAALRARGFAGAPVRAANGRIVGVVSWADLVTTSRGAGGETRTVAELMMPAPSALRDTDLAMNAVRLMVREEVQRVVGVIVLDERGELAGIVTPRDVLRALLDGEEPADDPGGAGPATIH